MPRYSHRSRTRRRNRGRFGPLFKLLCIIAVVVALTAGATVFFRVETVADLFTAVVTFPTEQEGQEA